MSARKPSSSKAEKDDPTATAVSAQQYEFEDPARSWVDLVLATQEKYEKVRKAKVYELLEEAKSSHWTHVLLDAEYELLTDAEYGGSFDDADPGGDYTEQDTEGYSDPEEGMNQVDRDVDHRTMVTARPWGLVCWKCGGNHAPRDCKK